MSKNKSILIIGATSDIAIAIAHKFAAEGYDLQLAARNYSEVELVANDLKIRFEKNVTTYELDILKYDTFPSFIESLNCLPDIAISAVGILGNQKDDEKTYLNSLLAMKTNYVGPSLLLGEIANHFEERGSGSIIGISSVAGDRGRASNYIYGSAKSGFTEFLSGLRNRLFKSNVNVLTVLPGFVRTKMTAQLELPGIITADAKEIANIIYKNLRKSKILYIFPWAIIMKLISLIPEFIFKRLSI
ncbi:SDR family oxidoreductase [Gammaproteobacteria bacterium]|nr:SDR family oxidoreductase [Gammaproteobacteria bacterium]